MDQKKKSRNSHRPDGTLIDSERRYRRLFEASQDGIIILDAGTGEILEVNRSFVQLLGYPQDAILGKKIWEIGLFMNTLVGQAIFRELQKKKVVHYGELPLETKDGQRRQVEFVSNTYLVEHRRVIQCNLRDISGWKRKIEELGALAKLPIENPDPILRLDHDGTILFANQASREFLDALGVKAGNRVPKFWRDIISEALKQQTHNLVEARCGGRTYSFFVLPVVEANYVNLYGRDETKRKQEEEARRAAEANYRALVEQIPAITYIDKADGSALSLFVSPQVKSILGVTQEEWMQGDISFWADMIHPEDRERVVSAYQHTLATGQPLGEEYRMIARDGHLVWIVDHAVLLEGANGQPNSLQGVMFDITERMQAQALQEAVYKIAIATEKTASLSDLYSQIHQIISAVMPAENFYITLYDETKNFLWFPYFRDTLDEPFLGEVEPGKGLTAYVLRTGKSLLCTQAVHDELERQGAVILLGVPSAIWLGVPLIVEGKTIGAMVVQHYSDPEAYSEREQHMLEFVSSQVAIAISRKQVEEKLRQLSTRDILTGLFNRSFFEAEMERLERGRQFPVSIVMADVDDLKATNDGQGHAAGDMLLKRLAQVLSVAFRGEDLVARIGGDEFAVVLPNTGAKEAEKALDRVRLILQEHNATHAGTLLQVSFGVSTGEKNRPLADVLKEADANMYAEKHANSAPFESQSRKKAGRTKSLS